MVSEGEVSAEDGVGAVEGGGGVFDVDMEDAVGESVDELDGIESLPDQVGGIEVDAEGGVVVECVECVLEGDDVVSDFGWVDFEGEAYLVL